ncbi:MAG: hypothetical protein EAY75_06045 [Bacteroidetes bacterium]|nr:MAG: hypothetical protein EAY75_06045 [Bacteroidota bacterium]
MFIKVRHNNTPQPIWLCHQAKHPQATPPIGPFTKHIGPGNHLQCPFKSLSALACAPPTHGPPIQPNFQMPIY